MQEDSPASPTFAVCLAYWLEQVTGRVTIARIVLQGTSPDSLTSPTEMLHWRRSQLLLDTYAKALGDRFEITPAVAWSWPAAPILNKATSRRKSAASALSRRQSEHHLEVALASSAAVHTAFSRAIEPIGPLQRQLPVGLFSDRVSEATRWMPGSNSGVDLWAISADGQTLHLFELKVKGNKKVGILPESLYYARMFRAFAAGRPHIAGAGPSLDQIRTTRRVVMWLTAPELHPLVYSERHVGAKTAGDSPLCWLNQGLAAEGIELRVLPWSGTPIRPELDFARRWSCPTQLLP